MARKEENWMMTDEIHLPLGHGSVERSASWLEEIPTPMMMSLTQEGS